MKPSLKSCKLFNVTIEFYCNNSDLNVSTFEDFEPVDDFRDIFIVTRFNMIFVILPILYVTLTNAFWISLMLYEKYGEDSLKRSINNQLVTQGGCAMIIWISVRETLFTWR